MRCDDLEGYATMPEFNIPSVLAYAMEHQSGTYNLGQPMLMIHTRLTCSLHPTKMLPEGYVMQSYDKAAANSSQINKCNTADPTNCNACPYSLGGYDLGSYNLGPRILDFVTRHEFRNT